MCICQSGLLIILERSPRALVYILLPGMPFPSTTPHWNPTLPLRTSSNITSPMILSVFTLARSDSSLLGILRAALNFHHLHGMCYLVPCIEVLYGYLFSLLLLHNLLEGKDCVSYNSMLIAQGTMFNRVYLLNPFLLFICFGWLRHVACGILVLQPRTEPMPVAVKAWSCNHEPSENSLNPLLVL